jgi:NADPH:quinone reductase-like Zn-dependent oxidoreductase
MNQERNQSMRAMAAPNYGPLAQLAQIVAPLPTPGPGEVRVRVVASALNPADYKVVLGRLKFLHARNRPLIVGYDFSGTVDAVGPAVTGVAVGDDVFGFLPYGPGNKRGAFAEALIARSDEIALKPANVTHENAAAAATSGLTALQSLRELGRLPASGGKLLVTGVSGGVGSISVAVAGRLNASVTALGSGAGLERARELGAVELVDRSTQLDIAKFRAQFDVIFDAAAAYRWRSWTGALKPGGAFVTTLPSLAFVVDKLCSLFSRTRVHFVNVKSRPADLRLLGSWLADGMTVPLSATIPVREVAQGLARLQTAGGRIAVRVADGF